VAGGEANVASGEAASVGGGQGNTASGVKPTIGGGVANSASNVTATVGGGQENTANGESATVGGGDFNAAGAQFAAIGGGGANSASGGSATVGGGFGNTASGLNATVPGGKFNTAQADNSLAAGLNAQANHTGAFVWADSNADELPFPSTAANQFSVRSTGGARFVSAINAATGAPTAGVQLAPGGGSWSSLSDEASKRAIDPISGRKVLRKLASMPVSTWSYRAQDDSIRHIGPMAQDFYRAFGVGEDHRHIASVDADGVALAAIKGLNERLNRKVDRLERELAALRERVRSR
jgi:trimeric autotransporter adhesin